MNSKIIAKHIRQLDFGNPDQQRTIPIVTAFDDNYAPYFGACLASIVGNSSKDYFYDIVVLGDNISLENENKLFQITVKKENFSLRFFEGDTGLYNHNASHGHFAPPTFFRIKLASLMSEYLKVLYIDPDTIVLQDLAKLFNIKLDTNYAAASVDLTYRLMIKKGIRVPESFGGLKHDEYLSKIGLDENSIKNYFNAGVMVFNLQKIRSDNLESKMIKLYEENRFNAVDQDILNLCFGGQVKYISESWNFIVQAEHIMKDCYTEDYMLYKRSSSNPYIIHYAGSYLKPWKCGVFKDEYFWAYLKMTLFYESIRREYEKIFEGYRDAIPGYTDLENASNVALFGWGESGKRTFGFLLKNINCKISYIIDDIEKGEYENIKIISTEEFITNCIDEVDLIVFGKYQKVNPKIFESKKLTVKLDNVS